MMMNERAKNTSLKKPSITTSLFVLPLILMTSPACAQETEESAQDAAQDAAEALPEISQAPDAAQDALPAAPIFDPDAPEAETAEPSAEALATLDMIDKALKEIDETIERDGNSWQFMLNETQVLVVSDPIAGRMRIMVPIIQADSLNPELLARMMQANFDSALDARYAIANGLLWGTYIHPLINLSEEQFLSGLGQTISIVNTFGTSFSSGTVVFGGGDSQNIIEEQIEEQEEEREANSFT